MSSVILIPARMASTRLPGKPLATVGDAPMIVQVWRRAVEARAGDVAVACDGEEIAAAITKAGGRAVITDPGLPSGSDRIWQALQKIDPQKKYDTIVNLQGDMPTLDPSLIARALKLLDDSRVDIGTLAATITDEKEKASPAVVKAVISFPPPHEGEGQGGGQIALPHPLTLMGRGSQGRALYFSRATIPHGEGPLFHHIGLYAYRRAALEKFVSLPPSPLEQREKLEQLRALEAGLRIEVAIVDTVPLGVDTPETLEKARLSPHLLRGLDQLKKEGAT